MDGKESWLRDLLHVVVLLGLCLLIGICLIHSTVLITWDGTFYIGQARQLGQDTAGVARRYPAGYPFLIRAAHEVRSSAVGRLLHRSSSGERLRGSLRPTSHETSVATATAPRSLPHEFRRQTTVEDAGGWARSAQAVSLLCRALALIPLYFLGKLLVGARYSFRALVILVALPYPAQYGSDALREWPYLLFLSLGFWLLYWGLQGRHWWVLALVGVDAGLGYLFRPECGQLVLYALLGLAVVGTGIPNALLRVGDPGMAVVGCVPRTALGARRDGAWYAPYQKLGGGLLVVAGFLVPVVPYVRAAGSVIPQQLQPPTVEGPPVISAVGPRTAADGPLEFEVRPGELLELPIRAADPQGNPLTFLLVGIPVGTRPIYEFQSYEWPASPGTAGGTPAPGGHPAGSTAGGDREPQTGSDPRPQGASSGIDSRGRLSHGDPCSTGGDPYVARRFWTVDEYEKHLLLSVYSREVWDYAGIVGYACGQAGAGRRGVWRFWSQARAQHIYTVDEQEKADLLQGSGRGEWVCEGIVFYVAAESGALPDTVPVYRFGDREHGYSWAVEGSATYRALSAAGARPGSVAWYVPRGGEPPAGAAIEGGVLRWRPGPGQQGDYQMNIIARGPRLESCQLVKIRVGPARGDAGQRTAVSSVIHYPSSEIHPASAVLAPQFAGLDRLPDAVRRLVAAVAEDFMVVFFVPWVLGLYWRLRYRAEPLERALVLAMIAVNVTLILGRHLAFGAGEDRRYALGLTVLTIFYVPVGLELMARWLGQWKGPALPSWPWFHILIAIGLIACVPKLLAGTRADKSGYRAAAEWLRQNTPAEAVLAVPDSRISFYAERPGLLYKQYPDSRRADYVVAIAGRDAGPAPQGWRQVYSVPVGRTGRGTVLIYETRQQEQ